MKLSISAVFSLFLWATHNTAQGFQQPSFSKGRSRCVVNVCSGAASNYFDGFGAESAWREPLNTNHYEYHESSNPSDNNKYSGSSYSYSKYGDMSDEETTFTSAYTPYAETTVIEPELVDESPEQGYYSSSDSFSKQESFIQDRLQRLETAFFQATKTDSLETVLEANNEQQQRQKLRVKEALRQVAEADERIAALEKHAHQSQTVLSHMSQQLEEACHQLREAKERIEYLEYDEREYAAREVISAALRQDKEQHYNKEKWHDAYRRF